MIIETMLQIATFYLLSSYNLISCIYFLFDFTGQEIEYRDNTIVVLLNRACHEDLQI